MRKSSLAIYASMALAAATVVPISAHRAADEAFREKTQHPSRTTQTGRTYRRIGNGFRYPEQSTRQAMRGFRRAQGGPGISLNSENHTYQVN
jgi:hypothetical protein